MEVIVEKILDLIFGLMNSNSVPKVVRYILSTIIHLALITLWVNVTNGLDDLADKIVSGMFVLLFLISYILFVRKIHKT